MYDPSRRRKDDLRFWQFVLFWRFIPSWKVAPEDRPIMWRAFWFHTVLGTGLLVALVLIIALAKPMAGVQEYVLRLAGPAAERNPGPYLLLSALLTVIGPVVVVASIWYGIRRYLRRRRGLDI